MNASDDLDRLVSARLDELLDLAPPPTLLTRTLDVTSRRRQRPAWLAATSGHHLHGTGTSFVIGRGKDRTMSGFARLATVVAALAVVAVIAAVLVLPNRSPAVGGPSSSPSQAVPSQPAAGTQPSAASSAVAPSAAASPSTFRSTVYGYSITLPAGWSGRPATEAWDGGVGPGPGEASVDAFVGRGTAAIWVFSAPTTKSLDRYVAQVIANNFKEHGDTCPEQPAAVEPVTIGGQPGRLISWDCGILINVAAVVRDGVGYHFPMRDPGVHAATDPGDRVTFVSMLGSVVFGP